MSSAKPLDDNSTGLDKSFPSSHRTYVSGKIHIDVRVPFRVVELTDTALEDGGRESNAPIRVYDTRGPGGDPDITCDPRKGLPALRTDWILNRGDTEEYGGRPVQPEDDGYISDKHRDMAEDKPGVSRLELYPGLKRSPRRATKGSAVTQMHYARRGIVTPEMEYVAIRENLGREEAFASTPPIALNWRTSIVANPLVRRFPSS